jgi:nucleotide-binding universal stress UspA family protein
MHEIPLSVLHVLPPTTGAYERVIRSAKHLVAEARGKTVRAPDRVAVPSSLAPSTMRWLMQLGHEYSVPRHDTTEVAVGDPAREIVRTAMEHGPSLVVVGMRGADEAPVGSIGAVARELLTRGPMPVLAVNAT